MAYKRVISSIKFSSSTKKVIEKEFLRIIYPFLFLTRYTNKNEKEDQKELPTERTLYLESYKKSTNSKILNY